MKVTFSEAGRWIVCFYIIVSIIISNVIFVNLFYVEIAFLMLYIAMCFFWKEKIRINSVHVWWALAWMTAVFSCAYSADAARSLRFVCLLLFFYVSLLFLYNVRGWETIAVKMLGVFCGIHMVITIIQFLFPALFYVVYFSLPIDRTTSNNLHLFQGGSYAGLMDETGTNAYFISIFILIIFNKMLENSEKSRLKKIGYVLAFLLSVFVLALTKKRSFILLMAGVCMVVWFVYYRKQKYKWKNIAITCIVLLVLILLASRSEIMSNIWQKMLYYQKQGDISNGRFILWKETWEIFLKNPFTGIGIQAIPGAIGMATHNVYIQLLAEVGIVGAVVFYMAMLTPVVKVVKDIISRKRVMAGQMISLSMQLLFLVYAVTGNPLYDHKMMWVYALGIALGQRSEE